MSDPRPVVQAEATVPDGARAVHPTPAVLFREFLRLGTTAFGGPAMVPYIERLAVSRDWLSKEEFAAGLTLCQSIPGATAMQTAAFVGLRAAGVAGAVAAYVGFGLPAVLMMLAASAAYSRALDLTVLQSVFRALHAVIVALVANAAFMFARSHLRSVTDGAVALASAVGLYFGLNPAAVIVGAVGVHLVLNRRPGALVDHGPEGPAAGTWRVALRTALGGIALTALLLALVPRLGELATVCMKVDVVAFGGGWTSLPLMFQQMVEVRHWVTASTFMDGIALGQVTPGPIVVTATFVGYQMAGLAGGVVATLAVFFPSFVLVLATAPWFDRLRAHRWFAPALRGALLSFVGLLGFVSFGLARALDWDVKALVLLVAGFVALRVGAKVPVVVLATAVIAALSP